MQPIPTLTYETRSRFWSKVDRNGPIQAGMASPCWVWMATRLANGGYGAFGIGRTVYRANRIALHDAGVCLDGLQVMHRCDHPPCVNPGHLAAVTQAENMADAAKKGRMRSGDRHGLRLHPERIARGERHGMAKLDDRRVRLIRRLLARGFSQQKVADLIGVGQQSISRISRGDQWTHVKGAKK